MPTRISKSTSDHWWSGGSTSDSRGRDTLADQLARASGQVIVEQDELEDLIATVDQVLEADVTDEIDRKELLELRHLIARLLGWTTASTRPD